MRMLGTMPSQKVSIAFLAGLATTILLQVYALAVPQHPLPDLLRDNLVLFATSMAGYFTPPAASDVATVAVVPEENN